MKIALWIIVLTLLFPGFCHAADKILFTYQGQTAWYSAVVLDTGERFEIKTPFKEVPKTSSVTTLKITNKIAAIKAATAIKVEEVKEVIK